MSFFHGFADELVKQADVYTESQMGGAGIGAILGAILGGVLGAGEKGRRLKGALEAALVGGGLGGLLGTGAGGVVGDIRTAKGIGGGIIDRWKEL
jgi:hypothetical protein